MPCTHKFKTYLNLSRLDFEPTTLIVGTFIPEWPANDAEWFYDPSTGSYLWDILPRMYGAQSLINATTDERKQFCHNNKIAITALISSIDDADATDKEHNKILVSVADQAVVYNFDDFDFVNIVQLLKSNPSIKNVYLTRGITEAFWKHVWNPVVKYCSQNNIHERRLLHPSSESAYQHGAYNYDHPEKPIQLLEDYILMRWQQEWHIE